MQIHYFTSQNGIEKVFLRQMMIFPLHLLLNAQDIMFKVQITGMSLSNIGDAQMI